MKIITTEKELRRVLSYRYSTQFKCDCKKESDVEFPKANIDWIIKELSHNSKKVTLWCSEHGEQEGNVCKKCLTTNSKTKPQCKFLYADWCHNPTVGQQEKCFFYHNNHNCKHYATNSKKEQDVSKKQ